MIDPVVRLDFPGATGERETLCFSKPVEVIVAEKIDEVRVVLQEVERAAARGRYVVGYLSYEAAPAFDPAYAVRPGNRLPLAWFGVFDAPHCECGILDSRSMAPSAEPNPALAPAELSDWEPTTSRDDYDAAITELQRAFARGELSQANYTLRLRARFGRDAFALYERLLAAQGRGTYGAYLDLGPYRIISASPELFFRRDGDRLVVCPMKGTARRGLWAEDDDARAALLARSAKDRAENLMTAEWMRGELERLARPGMVETIDPCAVECYPTVFQLTTTLEATLRPEVTLAEIFAELFPAVSVTGVPRLPAMRRIAELETAPREVYCGAIGVVRPGGDAVFNVAIRTLWLDAATGVAEYGVGGGITAASTAAGEYDEVRAKSVVLTRVAPSFELLETLRLESGEYVRLERHLARLGSSARYFGWPDPTPAARAELAEHARQWPVGTRRVRLLVDGQGEVRVESEEFEIANDGSPVGIRAAIGAADAGHHPSAVPAADAGHHPSAVPAADAGHHPSVVPAADDSDTITATSAAPLPVRLARTPISRDDPFLYHKTTYRQVHEARRAEWPDAFDVLLWNEAGELTEFTRGNLVVELDGVLWTPPRESGLLAGAFRAELLENGTLRERVLHTAELAEATGLWFINSLREWVPVRLR